MKSRLPCSYQGVVKAAQIFDTRSLPTNDSRSVYFEFSHYSQLIECKLVPVRVGNAKTLHECQSSYNEDIGNFIKAGHRWRNEN